MTRPNEPARPDIHQRVTDTIIAQLEAGVRPWTQPWASAACVTRPLRHDGTPYSGVNIILLWAEAAHRGFAAATWMTFRQALALGAHVRKGEKGSTVVYSNTLVRSETNEAGEDEQVEIPFLKAYTVFNVEQIDGLSEAYAPKPPAIVNPDVRIAEVEAFFANCRADLRHGGGGAFYAPGPDYVQMPPFETFHDAHGYYATLGHEMTHWTRHPSRLDRDFGRTRWGDANSAREELVAELGAAFLCADLGLGLEPREDHADYIGHWIGVLRDDKRFIVRPPPTPIARSPGCTICKPDGGGLTTDARRAPRHQAGRSACLCLTQARHFSVRAFCWNAHGGGRSHLRA